MAQLLTLEGRVRKDILDAALSTGKVGAHLAPSLSLVEIIIAVLSQMDRAKDSFILSKGHGALGYYAVMHQLGWISDEQFGSFETDGGEFPGQPSRSSQNRVEYSSGSLGMGLSYAVGVATAKKDNGGKVYVVVGDGETNEGSIWEAAALAAHLKLNNIVAIIDKNGLQSDGACDAVVLMDQVRLWDAHGWNVIECDGHSTEAIIHSIKCNDGDFPTAVIAETTKGKGISFMENDNDWHHHTLGNMEYNQALAELGEKYGFCEE